MNRWLLYLLVCLFIVKAWTRTFFPHYIGSKNVQKVNIQKKENMAKGPIFVVHKHSASHVHFDLRIQIGKVLTSWAVPKGPSCNPKEKRLAILMPDHPLSYGSFEGIIQEGYGAGTVMIWDTGKVSSVLEHEGKAVSLAQ